MGTIVKGYFASMVGVDPKQIYHVSIMPCYDRKLEASRKEFYLNEYQTPEVDIVLASSEVLQLIQDQKIDFLTLSCCPMSNIPLMHTSDTGKLTGVQGGTSGGFLEYVYKYAAKSLYNMDNININYKKGRNQDIVDVTLTGVTKQNKNKNKNKNSND
jgi:iron only hydrogenase large subunit-like protein